MWFLDKKPRSVFTIANNIATSKTIFKKNSMALVILEFPGNIIVKITANAVAVHDHFHEIKIFTKNMTINNTINGSFSFIKNKIKKNKFFYPDKKNRKKLIQNFLDTISNKKIKPIISQKEQFDLMSVCLTAEEAMNKNKKMKIKYI